MGHFSKIEYEEQYGAYPANHGRHQQRGTHSLVVPQAVPSRVCPTRYHQHTMGGHRGSVLRNRSVIGKDLTDLGADKRGPALRNILHEHAATYAFLMDREKLRRRVNGVQFSQDFLRPHFVKGAAAVFMWRFMT